MRDEINVNSKYFGVTQLFFSIRLPIFVVSHFVLKVLICFLGMAKKKSERHNEILVNNDELLDLFLPRP